MTMRELVAHREVIKASIYEVTGISDIMRGQTVASETMGAQQLKSQWEPCACSAVNVPSSAMPETCCG